MRRVDQPQRDPFEGGGRELDRQDFRESQRRTGAMAGRPERLRTTLAPRSGGKETGETHPAEVSRWPSQCLAGKRRGQLCRVFLWGGHRVLWGDQ